MNDGKTLYFSRNKRKKIIEKKLSKNLVFDHKFSFKKDLYLENSKYLIVISKHFIRVQIFNVNNNYDVVSIKSIINLVNS